MDLLKSGMGVHLDLQVLRFRNDPGREEPAMLAQQLLATGRSREAVDLTAQTLERDPLDADVLLMHGLALRSEGELETAQLAFMRAARLAPDWVEPWTQLASTLLQRNRPERALQVAERGLEIDPDDAQLGELRRGAQLELRAIRFLESPGQEEPTMLAQELLATGRCEAAFEVTRQALLEDIDDEDLLVTHARAARARGDLDEAVSVLRMATYEAPEWTEVWCLLAETLSDQGLPDQARDAAARARFLDPADHEIFALHERLAAAAETLVTL